MTDPVLLDTRQVATFVARGFLEFPGVIDAATNDAAAAELTEILATWGSDARPNAPQSGQSWRAVYPDPSAIGAVLRHPVVAGAVESLVGADAIFDHDFVHDRPAGDTSMQKLHADAIVDPNLAFDIQVFYFPNEVGPDGGGTGFVPGTHLRLVHETDIARYHHVAGERQWSGPAGSILVFHHGLWHRGMPNPSDTERLMYKARFNPTSPQMRRWDLGDFDEVHNDASDHLFARFRTDSVAATLRSRERWHGEADHRLDLLQRARLWRYLSGDDTFDADWYLTRHGLHADLAGR